MHTLKVFNCLNKHGLEIQSRERYAFKFDILEILMNYIININCWIYFSKADGFFSFTAQCFIVLM